MNEPVVNTNQKIIGLWAEDATNFDVNCDHHYFAHNVNFSGGKQWQPELTVEPSRRGGIIPKRSPKQPPSKQRPPGPPGPAPPLEEPTPMPMRPPPGPPFSSSTTEDPAYKLQEVSMSNYLPTPRRYAKPGWYLFIYFVEVKLLG